MFGMKVNNMNEDQYFVIRVWYFEYKDTDKYQYSIVSDRAYNLDKAMNIKMAQDIMEANENISFQIQKVNLMNLGKSKIAS
jgi:hypothetical protein|tara:strand:- start:316 stop:558 length:243 start_codon:yes stop_codon:yes gene_type:complete